MAMAEGVLGYSPRGRGSVLSSGDGGEMVSFFYFPDRAQRAF